jgi:hypothetical protein
MYNHTTFGILGGKKMSDLIDREALKRAMYNEAFEKDSDEQRWDSGCWIRYHMFERVVNSMPAVQPEIKPIEYRECANAMLRMWMDNVVTDGEYNRIMAKLNVHWRKED